MASTYVNNLRLEEIGTGEQSGTWGDTTNTNLEIIGQAVAWGTRAIANASTDNITIADGALDADRCLGLKLTGGGQACTVTLLPNTSSKTWFMYNATAADLTFTCGSGANVVIPAGQTKVIATDGLGSGGVVHDLLTAVNLAGTTVVDDLTVSDDLTVTDDATVGGTLGVTGVVTANAGVVVDNITIDGQEIDVSSGDLTLDVAGDITLNADGGDIFLADDSVTFGKLKNSSSHFFIQSLVADKDILIIGNDSDGGGAVTAVEFDMSDAGTAKFGHDAKFADSAKAIFGGGDDLQIFYDGSNAFINNLVAGALSIKSDDINLMSSDSETMASFVENGAVSLYHDNAKKFETSSIGVSVTGRTTMAAGGSLFFGERGNLTHNDTSYNMTFNANGLSAALVVEGTGNVTLAKKMVVSAADGVAANDFVGGFVNLEATAGQSFGLSVQAGTNGSDIALNVINKAADTALLRVFGNGTTTIGNALTLTDGNLIVAAGHGIDFSAQTQSSSTTGAELLDHYEEGTWTPVITPEGGSAASITVNHASYTRVGRLTSLVFQVTIGSISGTNSSNAIELTGMPFPLASGSGAGGPNISYSNLTASMTGTLALQGNTTTKYRIVNLNGTTGLNASDHLQASSVLRGQFTYHSE